MKNTFLIIDDDSVSRHILTRWLKKVVDKPDIFECSNGKEAYDFLADTDKRLDEYPNGFPPIIIFVDINMPILGGFGFLDKITEFNKNNNIYEKSIFVMFSSSSNEIDMNKAKEYQVVRDYIVKSDINQLTLNNLFKKFKIN